MASHPGYSLECFVEDIWFEWGGKNESKNSELSKAVIEALEPVREYVEFYLDDYDEDSQAWRDYRNQMIERIDEQIGMNWRFAGRTSSGVFCDGKTGTPDLRK